jgi:hypothetical protein
MAEYKIKFEYGALGKKAAAGRQQAIQASKKQGSPSKPSPFEQKKGGQAGFPSGFDKAVKDNSNHLKKLNSALSKAGKDFQKGAKPDKATKELPSAIRRLDGSTALLNKTNQALAQETKRVYSGQNKLVSALKGLKGGGGGGGSGAGKGMGAGGLGGIGASIPVLGAVIGLAGFALSKINDVGNAYIDLTSEQIGSVGVGGYRGAKGNFTGTEIGAGMKSYGMATGKFSTKYDEKGTDVNLKRARDIGTIFGESAETTYQNAGAFARAGVSYEKAAAIGAGGGVESELQMLLSGMGDIMADAVREGVDTSNLSDDMAKNLAGLVQATPAKSVEAALNVVRSFQGTKQQLAAGQLGSAEGLMASKASEQLMMDKLSDPAYVQSLVDKKIIGAGEAQKISGMKKGSSYSDLQRAIGGSTTGYLQRQFSSEVDTSELQRKMFQNISESFKGNKAQAFNYMAATGFSGSQNQWQAAWDAAQNPMAAADLAQKGVPIIDKASTMASKSAAYIGKNRTIARQGLVSEFGGEFADTSLKMERQLMGVARAAGPSISKAVDFIGDAVTDPSKAMSAALGMATGALSEFTNSLKESAKGVVDSMNPLKKLDNKKTQKNLDKLQKTQVAPPPYMLMFPGMH